MKLTPIIRYYENNTSFKRIDISAIDDIKWDTDLSCADNDYNFSFKALYDIKEDCSVGIKIEIEDWHKDNYVFMPASVYNGNRFKTVRMKYPPLITDKNEFKLDMPVYQNDIPRLNIDPGDSRIQQLAGDLSVPCIGIYFRETKKSLFLFTPQEIENLQVGFEIEESLDRNNANITILAPGVREELIYHWMKITTVSPDRGKKFLENELIDLPVGIYNDHCDNLEEFFSLYVKYRENYHKNELINYLPLSKSFQLIEDKYNKWNWYENSNISFYTAGIGDGLCSKFQTGWVGGGMVTESFLIDGLDISRERSVKNLQFIFKENQSKSGFIYGGHSGEMPICDCFSDKHPHNMSLIRKNADLLFFIMKQLPILDKMGYEIDYKDNIQKLADAFVKLWDKYRQFGQFIDIESGEILIGGSLSASTAIGGLALAYEYFKNNNYERVAKEACDFYYKTKTQEGICNGGPGEILSAVDSESSAGILDSYMTMYNVFGDEKYLKYSISAANYLLTWVMNYDFNFPKESLFGKWNIKSSGSVFANVQNKHSAPGYCTLSGESLFELYRLTKNPIYLNSIVDTAHNITSYLITDERKKIDPKTKNMITNTMNERVETSDWSEPVGEIFDGSCWCEVSDLLTYTEIPGLYIDKENNIICPIDHIEIKNVEKDNNLLIFDIYNPTDYDMTLKIFLENKKYRIDYLNDFIKLDIKSKEKINMKF